MNFTEVEIESNSQFYRVFKIKQTVDETKRFKRDLFDHVKAANKEKDICGIKCPLVGNGSSAAMSGSRDDK